MKPLAISAAARERLSDGARAKITARYRHGIELSLHDHAETVFVSARQRGILPMHIVLRQRDLHFLMTHAVIGSTLYFSARTDVAKPLTIALTCRRVHTELPRATCPMIADARTRLKPLFETLPTLFSSTQFTGLGNTIDEMFDPQWRWRAAFESAAPGADGETTSAHLQAVRALLGRGQGATPAGDDMLLGALALHRACLPEPSLLEQTLTALDDQLPQLTTATSVAYLRWALRGVFGSHLLSLVRDIRDGCSNERIGYRAQRVARHGASSGHDTLLGIALAGRSLAAGTD